MKGLDDRVLDGSVFGVLLERIAEDSETGRLERGRRNDAREQ